MSIRIDRFYWDDYVRTATYSEVANLSPHISLRSAPTMYSPDRSRFLVTSLDLDFKVSNTDHLFYGLEECSSRLKGARHKKGPIFHLINAYEEAIELILLLRFHEGEGYLSDEESKRLREITRDLEGEYCCVI